MPHACSSSGQHESRDQPQSEGADDPSAKLILTFKWTLRGLSWATSGKVDQRFALATGGLEGASGRGMSTLHVAAVRQWTAW